MTTLFDPETLAVMQTYATPEEIETLGQFLELLSSRPIPHWLGASLIDVIELRMQMTGTVDAGPNPRAGEQDGAHHR